MALRHYEEYYGGWVCPNASSDDQWIEYDLTSFGVPASAVVEIAIAHPRNNTEYWAGVRSKGSSIDRRVQIAESEGEGDHICTMLVQADADSHIEYYSDYYAEDFPSVIAPNFTIVGWWIGCQYVEKFENFTASSDSVWESYALDQYGISGSPVVDIALANSSANTGYNIGIRSSGSQLERQFHIKEAEGGGETFLSIPSATSGNNAAIDIYVDNTLACSYYLLGYFEIAPGNFSESFIQYPKPDSQNEEWQNLDIGSSGIPSGCTANIIVSHNNSANSNQFGSRSTSSSLERILNLDESETDGTTPGRTWCSMYVNTDDDGYIQYMAEDISYDVQVYLDGYWNNFTNSDIPFIKSNCISCFIQGLNPNAHYIELDTDPGTITTSPAETWNTLDLTAYGVPASSGNMNIVAEVIISNEDNVNGYYGGARSTDSNLDRKFQLHNASNYDVESISVLVPVDISGAIQVYAEHISDITFRLAGYWCGGHYIESASGFNASSGSVWENYDLGSDYANTVVEVLVENLSDIAQSGGVRQIGSSLNRYFEICKTIDGVERATLHVNTSGVGGTIQVYAQNTSGIQFNLIGKWDIPPGQYNERFHDVGTVGENSEWYPLAISGVTEYDVCEIALEHRENDSSRSLGVRQIGSTLDTRYYELRETGEAINDTSSSIIRIHSNITSGNYAEFWHDIVVNPHTNRLVGYWNNLRFIPIIKTSTVPAIIFGHAFGSSIDLSYPSGVTLYIDGAQKKSIDLFINGNEVLSNNVNIFIDAYNTINTNDNYPSGIPMNIHGAQLKDINLFTYGLDTHYTSNDLYIFGINFYATDPDYSVGYPSGVSCYIEGIGLTSHNDECNLFINSKSSSNASNNLYTQGIDFQSKISSLFLKVLEQTTASINMYIHNPVDPGSGIIRESNCIFYLSRRDHYPVVGNITEHIETIDWPVSSTIITNTSWLPIVGATTTVGDGTLPIYNDMGGGLSSHLGGYALEDIAQNQQHVCGRIQDYVYPGSGSITAAFWMSGAKTAGNQVDVGWFWHSLESLPSGDFQSPGSTIQVHSVGLRIADGNNINVYTTVKDKSYDQVGDGSGWWGGTTHWGTPTGSDWSWNPNESGTYHTWRQFWPEQNIPHDDIAFFIVRSEFIPSGIDGDAPDHMKVYLSVDGQPWVYIGSGITGPPTGTLYSSSDPNNQYAENAIGVKLRAVNQDGGLANVSISVNEVALWSDSSRFTEDELLGLYSTVANYYRPLSEYKPTISPLPTYINRTISPFTYEPFIPSSYYQGEIWSGCLVTLEVGLGNYGEDCSAYLLEEIPPSGFQVRDISPLQVTYPSQGSRPPTKQQIFHDPQSGIIQPYENDWANTYGAAVRWICHHNHPEKDQRRSPRPTATYTYKLYPIHHLDVPRVDDFSFSGSGLFFGGTTGSGVFTVLTTGDVSGTTSGLTGSTVMQGMDMYISGPPTISGTASLYLRTLESFTSAYIGTAARTPKITDFIYAADGAAAIESMAGMEYGPHLCIKGPLQCTETCNLVIFGPAADNTDLFIHGHNASSTSGNYPSGMLLKVGDGHLVKVGSGTLFALGPVPYSGNMYMHTRAGAFEPPIDLFMTGHEWWLGSRWCFTKGPEFTCSSGNFPYPEFDYPINSGSFTYPSGGKSPDLYIKGPEFICSSGSFDYPGDPDDFTYPYGDPSPTLYMCASETATGTCPLYIGPLKHNQSWTIYLKTEDNDKTGSLNLFINCFTPPSGSSGVNQTFNNARLYLEAADADYPYTAGGTEEWTLFLKAQDGNLTSDEAWTLFLKSDFTVPASCSMYMRGHASGEAPRGNEISDSVGLVCSVNPDDPTRIGSMPCNAHGDPWTLFLKCEPGYFGTATLYMSGAIPALYSASGNLFVEGLFEQETGTALLYLMGISGLFNNGPSGLHLFLDAGTLVYNTSGNLYTHGY